MSYSKDYASPKASLAEEVILEFLSGLGAFVGKMALLGGSAAATHTAIERFKPCF